MPSKGCFSITFFGEEEIRPAVELLQELLQPVYDSIVNPGDPLRWTTAAFATYYAREEISLAEDENGDGDWHPYATTLYEALPNLQDDTGTVELGPQDLEKLRQLEPLAELVLRVSGRLSPHGAELKHMEYVLDTEHTMYFG